MTQFQVEKLFIQIQGRGKRPWFIELGEQGGRALEGRRQELEKMAFVRWQQVGEIKSQRGWGHQRRGCNTKESMGSGNFGAPLSNPTPTIAQCCSNYTFAASALLHTVYCIMCFSFSLSLAY